MAHATGIDRPPVAGRVVELAAVTEMARDAARGRASAMVLSGEAGVGKTSLLRDACDQVAESVDVLWASCLPLASLAVPLLPLRSALRQSSVHFGADPPVPDLGQAAGEAMVEFDAWLDRASSRPCCWWWTTCTGRTRARSMR